MVKVLEVPHYSVKHLNHAATLLSEYFLHVAHGEVENINIFDWKRLSDIIDSTAKGNHRIFLAYIDGEEKPVGIGGINRQGCAQHLYVREGFRGKGVAQKLIRARFNAGAWFATVLTTNTPSISLMKKMGMEEMTRYQDLIMFVRPSDFESGEISVDFLDHE